MWLILPKLHVHSLAQRTHYLSRPVQYAATFTVVKIDNVLMKYCETFVIFAQKINCVYLLEMPC